LNANDQTKQAAVSPDAVYREMYTELRRYRDYELTVATWFTTILLALLAGVFVIGFGREYRSPCHSSISLVGTILGVFVLILGLIGWRSSRYAGMRYDELRTFTNTLEPRWKQFTPRQRCKLLKPGTYIPLIPMGVASIIVFVLICFPPVRA
jgi:hypothetical protein